MISSIRKTRDHYGAKYKIIKKKMQHLHGRTLNSWVPLSLYLLSMYYIPDHALLHEWPVPGRKVMPLPSKDLLTWISRQCSSHCISLPGVRQMVFSRGHPGRQLNSRQFTSPQNYPASPEGYSNSQENSNESRDHFASFSDPPKTSL